MNRIKLKRLKASWSELTGRDLVYIARLFGMRYSREAIMVKLLCFWGGIRLIRSKPEEENGELFYWFRIRKRRFVISEGTLLWLLGRLSWLFTSPNNIIPLSRIAFRRARNRWMYDATFDEFIHMLQFYYSYVFEDNEESLNCLCSIMYPKGKWNNGKIVRRSWAFRYVFFARRYSVVLWCSSILRRISDECPLVFPRRQDSEEPVQPNVKEMLKCFLHDSTEGDVTKNDQVLTSGMWDVLFALDMKYRNMMEKAKKR